MHSYNDSSGSWGQAHGQPLRQPPPYGSTSASRGDATDPTAGLTQQGERWGRQDGSGLGYDAPEMGDVPSLRTYAAPNAALHVDHPAGNASWSTAHHPTNGHHFEPAPAVEYQASYHGYGSSQQQQPRGMPMPNPGAHSYQWAQAPHPPSFQQGPTRYAPFRFTETHPQLTQPSSSAPQYLDSFLQSPTTAANPLPPPSPSGGKRRRLSDPLYPQAEIASRLLPSPDHSQGSSGGGFGGEEGVEIMPFISKLFFLLSDPERFGDCLRWDNAGRGFLVAHTNPRMAQEVLPEVFSHSQVASLTRQLNIYSFIRMSTTELAAKIDTQQSITSLSDYHGWAHPGFTQNATPEELASLKPKPSKARLRRKAERAEKEQAERNRLARGSS